MCRRHPRARAREQGDGVGPARVEHRPERPRLRFNGRHPGALAVGEPGTEAVVADDPMAPREVLEEAARIGVLPLLLEVRDPAPAEQEGRSLADGGIRDAAPVERAEADVLLHHPKSPWPDRAMSRRWPAAATR